MVDEHIVDANNDTYFDPLVDEYLLQSCVTRHQHMLIYNLGGGKTALLYKLKLNENISTIPTIGFNEETITTKNGVSLTVCDVGGQEKIRTLWIHYIQNLDGLIYVVDSAHRQSIGVSAVELHAICDKEEMRGVPLVVIANKQDLPDTALAIKKHLMTTADGAENRMNEAEVVSALNLSKLNDRKWTVKGTSVITGDGLSESMEMIASLVNERRVGATGKVTTERDL